MKSPDTRDKRNHSQDDLPKHVEALINDIRQIMAKVDEFQFQLRLAWKRHQGPNHTKELNEHRRT